MIALPVHPQILNPFTTIANTHISKRDPSSGMSTTMIDLLISLMVLIFVSLLLVAALYTVRKIRRQRAIARQQLPVYHDSESRVSVERSHRRLTITASGRGSSVYVYDEKHAAESCARPSSTTSDVPEIRITFPDEQDESGRRTSGRVVVVRVGETGVGLEPLKDEQLPAYEKETGSRFHSIDMDRIGGLKEKSSWS